MEENKGREKQRAEHKAETAKHRKKRREKEHGTGRKEQKKCSNKWNTKHSLPTGSMGSTGSTAAVWTAAMAVHSPFWPELKAY